MELREILSKCDHTLLRPDASWSEIQSLCRDGLKYRTASVCIPASYVRQAKEFLDGGLAVCTVIGFPNGYDTTAAKCFMASDAVENGADEIDMVIHLGWVKDGRFSAVEREIAAVKVACDGRLLKVIVEACLLSQEEKIAMCHVVTNAGADYIKTSTGFSSGGATFADSGGCGNLSPAGRFPPGNLPDREIGQSYGKKPERRTGGVCAGMCGMISP